MQRDKQSTPDAPRLGHRSRRAIKSNMRQLSEPASDRNNPLTLKPFERKIMRGLLAGLRRVKW